MKWSEVERPRGAYLQSRRYPIISKTRRRQEEKDRINIMQHQYHVGYNCLQGTSKNKKKKEKLFQVLIWRKICSHKYQIYYIYLLL